MPIKKSDRMIVRDYITALDHLQYTQLPEDVVAILLTHSNLPSKHVDIRLKKHMTIADVKEKFRTHIGTGVAHQRLILKRNGEMVCEMSDDSRMLGFYSVESGNEIHVIDTDPFSMSRGGGLTDTSLIEKYKMDDETYDKRKGTLREWVREKRKEDPNFRMKTNANAPSAAQGQSNEEAEVFPGVESVEGITVGARCEVNPGKRRGEVKFVGEVPQLKGGYWVGVVFDEPVGLTNGSVKGVSYFECAESYGSFVRAKNMEVGDFPEKDLMDEDDEEEI